MKANPIFNYPLFALGFRAFFTLAGLSALLLIMIWNAMLSGKIQPHLYFPSYYWHAHEMLLGYNAAVIAGFLLTAVKNWTGKPTLTYDALAGFCLLWLYGRILPFYAELLPDFFIALVDFAFLPLLTFIVAKPIIATRQSRNYWLLVLLLALTFANGLMHLEFLQTGINTAATGLTSAVGLIILLILTLAGRVFPFFTERAIPGTLIIKHPVLDVVSIASASIVFILQILEGSGALLAITASLAAVSNILRLVNWYVPRIRYVPLLWVLYLGYLWIIAGFVLTALAAYQLTTPALGLHAFTVGGIGVLTLGMMARVSLGHTGRALKASNTIALAFVLLNIAVVLRVLLPIAFPAWYNQFLYGSVLAWLAAFALFVFVYIPMLSNKTR
ncbi:NnrS family protein [Methylocucumis oryzae]|uniref:NnrS family protein n=1 Tax=Methylocucumis oryzae TaxID=1632867 RepID=UPI000B2520DF